MINLYLHVSTMSRLHAYSLLKNSNGNVAYPNGFTFPDHPGFLQHIPGPSMGARHVPVESDTSEFSSEFIAWFYPGRTEWPTIKTLKPHGAVLDADSEPDEAKDNDSCDSSVIIDHPLQADDDSVPDGTRPIVFGAPVTTLSIISISSASFRLATLVTLTYTTSEEQVNQQLCDAASHNDIHAISNSISYQKDL